jgi:LCP family protein required for cell wall assembly
VDEVRADEPGAAGDEDAHQPPTCPLDRISAVSQRRHAEPLTEHRPIHALASAIVAEDPPKGTGFGGRRVPNGTAARRPPAPGLRLGVRAVAALLSLLVIVGSGVAWASYQNLSASIPRGAAVPPLGAGQSDVDGADQNILLIGNDSRAGATPAELKALNTQDDGGSVNTDTMMVLHVPANGSRPTVVSFPRDSWVDIPGNGKGKINSAYGDGYAAAKDAHRSEQDAQSAGIVMVVRTIESLTGLHVDHYAQINLLGFYRISNAIGGVTVCLNQAQNPETDSDAYGKGYSGINLPAGVSVIEGSQALAFVRQRHGLPNGDLDRIKRQQYFLSSAFHTVVSAGTLLNPFKLHNLLNAVGSSLLVDPTLDLISLARQFESLAGGNIDFATIPNNGPQVIHPDGVETAIVGVDTAALPGFVRTLQGKPADPALAAASTAAPSGVTVDVLNGAQVTGLAARNADRLKALGFTVNVVDSTVSPATATTIEYPPGGESAAKAVAGAVPGAKLVLTSNVKRVTLVLGGDGLQVRGLGSTQPSGAPATVATPATTRAAAPGLGCIN